jgi:hypothetical protein
VGEAGCGKTALVRARLIDVLREDGRSIPVYLNNYGQDWVRGPLCSLSESLWDTLSADQRAKLEMTERHDPDKVVAQLTKVREILGVIPLLIFDQFDDYQLRHARRFLDEKQNTWLAPGQLTRANPFWREVKQLILKDRVHVVFVTRADSADGLTSVQFLEPRVYRLTRLPAHMAKVIVARMTSTGQRDQGVVLDPEYGWEKLCERLACDLDEDGTVLPIRVKLALLGLARLKALTVSAYERFGGLPALEAGYIEFHIREAARAGQRLSDEAARQLLLKMVNREALKTIEKTRSDLLDAEIRHGQAQR